jgi:hypothetical protein
VNTKPVAS